MGGSPVRKCSAAADTETHVSGSIARRTIVLGLMAAWAPLNVLAADPSRPVRVIVPTPPGSAADALARAMSAPWSRISGRPVVVENIVGAGTTIGTSQLVRAAKDGLTLGIISSNHTINPWLYKKLPYDAIADITPIAMIGSLPAMLVANNRLGATTPAELATLSRAARTPLAEGIVSGTAYHLVSEMFKEQAGIATTCVPYKGSAQVINDVMGGTLDIGFVPAQAAAPLVAAGRLKALAVTTAARTATAPQVPTLLESGLSKFNVDIWIAVVGPAGLNAADIAARRNEVEQALAQPEMKSALEHQGIQAIKMSQAELLPFLKSELERKRIVVQRVGITIN